MEADTLKMAVVQQAIEILPNTHLWGYMFIFAGLIHLLVAMLFFAMDRDNPLIQFKQWFDKRNR
jgi:sugar phosphate permease